MQILRNEVIEFLFLFSREKLLQYGDTLCVSHIFQDLTSQRSLAKWSKSAAQVLIIGFVEIAIILHLETFEVAESIIINYGCQTVKFKYRVLERRCRQKNFLAVSKCVLYCVGDFVGRFIDITEAVSLIYNYQIPICLFEIWCFCLCELIGANDDFLAVERIEIAVLYIMVERL